MDKESFLLVEKYRPKTIDELILPKQIKEQLSGFVQSTNLNNCIFNGSAGVGKTSAARAIGNQLGADVLYINFSNETGIDVIRNKVIQFASTASFEGNQKIVLGDEIDRLSANGQDALKATIEEFHKTCRFIFTTNHINRIIDPIKSRCNIFDFKISESEKRELMVLMVKRSMEILKKEEIEFDPKSVAALVQKYFPDFRKTLNELQRYSSNGKIDVGILIQQETNMDDLILSMKEKKFGDVRKWVARNSDIDSTVFFRHFYDNSADLFEGKSIPNIILILAQYQSYSAIVVDQEINNIACLVEIMGSAEWK